MSVQKELMRHASIQTTMNVYGKAMSDTKRQAHSKIVAMVLRKRGPGQKPIHRETRLVLGVNGSLQDARLRPQPVESVGCGGRI